MGDTEASMYKVKVFRSGKSDWTGVDDPKCDDPIFIDCSEAHLNILSDPMFNYKGKTCSISLILHTSMIKKLSDSSMMCGSSL